jgi:biotin operon repressor
MAARATRTERLVTTLNRGFFSARQLKHRLGFKTTNSVRATVSNLRSEGYDVRRQVGRGGVVRYSIA